MAGNGSHREKVEYRIRRSKNKGMRKRHKERLRAQGKTFRWRRHR